MARKLKIAKTGGISIALAMALFAGLCPLNGNSAEAKTLDTIPVSLQGVYTLGNSDLKEIFGVSDRNGENTPDAYTVRFDPETKTVWAPLFKDENRANARFEYDGALRMVKPESLKPLDGLTYLRKSRFTKQEVLNALAEMDQIAHLNKLDAAYNYSPKYDAITITTDPQNAKVIPPTLGCVPVVLDGHKVVFDVHQ